MLNLFQHLIIIFIFLEKLSSCDIKAAIEREKQIKNWHREWKNNLVKEINPDWKDLSGEEIPKQVRDDR